MDNNYQKFFQLREDFPKLVDLISELYAAYFRNHDSFPTQFYIFGNYSRDDILCVLINFGLHADCSTFTIRNSICTLITLL